MSEACQPSDPFGAQSSMTSTVQAEQAGMVPTASKMDSKYTHTGGPYKILRKHRYSLNLNSFSSANSTFFFKILTKRDTETFDYICMILIVLFVNFVS